MEKELANRLSTLRKSRNLSQAAVAMALGVSRSQVSSWEIGRRNLTLKDAIAMSKYYQMTLDELLKLEA